MSHLVHLRSAVGWLIVALLATVVLINVIGFLSPFWAHWRYPGQPGHGRDLLLAWRPWVAVASLLYLPPAWYLSKTLPTRWARGGVMAMGACVVVAQAMAMLANHLIDDPALAHLTAGMGSGAVFVGLMGFTGLTWRALRIVAPINSGAGAP